MDFLLIILSRMSLKGKHFLKYWFLAYCYLVILLINIPYKTDQNIFFMNIHVIATSYCISTFKIQLHLCKQWNQTYYIVKFKILVGSFVILKTSGYISLFSQVSMRLAMFATVYVWSSTFHYLCESALESVTELK